MRLPEKGPTHTMETAAGALVRSAERARAAGIRGADQPCVAVPDGSSGVKRLIVSQPRREAAHDITGKAYISVAAEGRRGRVMLSLAQDHEADALVRRIGAALRPACSFLP